MEFLPIHWHAALQGRTLEWIGGDYSIDFCTVLHTYIVFGTYTIVDIVNSSPRDK